MKKRISYGLIILGLLSFVIALFAIFEVFDLVPCSELFLITFSGFCAIALAIMHKN